MRALLSQGQNGIVFVVIKFMKYLLIMAPFVGLIAWHNAWQSIECPLLLSIGILICLTIKAKANEQRKKEGPSERNRHVV